MDPRGIPAAYLQGAEMNGAYEWFKRRFIASEKCESPMEELFHVAVQVVRAVTPVYAKIPQLIPQYVHGPYRIDFAAVHAGTVRPYRLAVEIDGHDFHDRTKEQASRDRERDRSLIADGWKVLRFTGSDVNRRPLQVAEEVLEAIHREHYGETAEKARTASYLQRLREIIEEA